jgi:hypothetical protein
VSRYADTSKKIRPPRAHDLKRDPSCSPSGIDLRLRAPLQRSAIELSQLCDVQTPERSVYCQVKSSQAKPSQVKSSQVKSYSVMQKEFIAHLYSLYILACTQKAESGIIHPICKPKVVDTNQSLSATNPRNRNRSSLKGSRTDPSARTLEWPSNSLQTHHYH